MRGLQATFKKSGVWLVAMGLALTFGAFYRANAQDLRTKAASGSSANYQETTSDYNRRLLEFSGNSEGDFTVPASDYRIGADDQLDVSVLEASEIDRPVRVSASGQIALPLVGSVRAAGLTTQELSAVIEEILRRNYIKDPHVTVQVREIQSHSVSVFGAVKKPGVFQIRGPKSVIELLSMAEGLNDDAGDTVIVDRHDELPSFRSVRESGSLILTGPPASSDMDSTQIDGTGTSPHAAEDVASGSVSQDTAAAKNARDADVVTIDLKKLLETGDTGLNIVVFPGDIVKVTRAELVYVVGEVTKPGGFELKSNENVSVLQAIALAQGLTHTSAAAHSRIIRTDPLTGVRQEIPIDLKKVLAGKLADPLLAPRDIVFVPNSASRTAMYRSIDAAISVGTGVAVYRW